VQFILTFILLAMYMKQHLVTFMVINHITFTLASLILLSYGIVCLMHDVVP